MNELQYIKVFKIKDKDEILENVFSRLVGVFMLMTWVRIKNGHH